MINLCIHGHFYQPTRENPWTGEIELQESASPYHDWNEKIYSECYLPNAQAKILQDDKVIDTVNNFEYINFNFGPTLFNWLLEKHHETAKSILEADRKSIKEHNGHGNAIAQVYNHMIMPLANFNDKVTQVRWGLKYFRHHFQRESEGIWLAETACNQATIEVLINEGVKYIILDTGQAASFRENDSIEWFNVHYAGVSPLVPYKCYLQNDKNKFINIFFYDGPLSRSAAFENTLVTSEILLVRILDLIPSIDPDDKIISLATDGETFGHHKKNAGRTLAYLLKYLVPRYQLKLVNFGEYLELYPPTFEVKLKDGLNGEGTSWSCPHGVLRWKDDCGCGGGVWHQKWRKPLREAIDWLRDELIIVFENIGGQFLKNVWDARNDYIELLIDNSENKIQEFFDKHSKFDLNDTQKNICINLFEMQKYAMFMYTSCSWFFSEISGLESIKILEYASRAIELAHELKGSSLEAEFLDRLSQAESNLPEYKNGKGVYLKLVKPPMTENVRL